MKEFQEKKILAERKKYVCPSISVHAMMYDLAMLDASFVGLDTPGQAMDSDGGLTKYEVGGEAGEIENGGMLDNAKSWGSIWEDE